MSKSKQPIKKIFISHDAILRSKWEPLREIFPPDLEYEVARIDDFVKSLKSGELPRGFKILSNSLIIPDEHQSTCLPPYNIYRIFDNEGSLIELVNGRKPSTNNYHATKITSVSQIVYDHTARKLGLPLAK